MNTVWPSYGTLATVTQFVFAEVRQQPDRRYEVSKYFFAPYCDTLNIQTSVWTERVKQMHRHNLTLH